MPDFAFEAALKTLNPWWENHWGHLRIEAFRRNQFSSLWRDYLNLKQIVSLTGPRRIGKTQLMYQMIQDLVSKEHADPRRVVYMMLDDPSLSLGSGPSHPIEELIKRFPVGRGRGHGSLYVFLDEIQSSDRWELYLKKYYDLHLPIRWMITGSASSPIFRKSRESLLGRIKDHHLLPFSFKEYVFFRFQSDEPLLQAVLGLSACLEDFLRHPDGAGLWSRAATVMADFGRHRTPLEAALNDYILYGGFPETWGMPDLKDRQEYLWDNQVHKVIHEDLVLTTSFRKPKNIERFFLYLLTNPGREIALDRISNDIQVSRLMLERYLPLLEMTDLVKTIQRFTRRPLRLKRGAFKCYLVDLGLSNAVLKAGPEVFADSQRMGYYAENLVFSTLLRWQGVIELSYFREREKEIDFVVTLAAGKHLPIEVKYTTQRQTGNVLGQFLTEHKQPVGIVVTRQDQWHWNPPVLEIPLVDFLLLFDEQRVF